MIEIDLEGKDKGARAGVVGVGDKEVQTPLFMPVGTSAVVKTLTSDDLVDLDVEAIIVNAYHLLMKPGVDLIEGCGGLHDFMNWDGLIFSDSGGFQMIRKGFDKEIERDHVTFKSDYDGSTYEITPEEDIELQKRLGSDIAMCLDYCPPFPSDRGTLKRSVEITTQWAERCKKAGSNIFGISQGGVDPELRERSCREIVDIGFDGYAVGGLSIGETKEKMFEMIDITNKIYPEDKPRYMMGLGSPIEMLDAIEKGMDIFDSAYPTRNARHGTVFTSDGPINIGKSGYKKDGDPLSRDCDCPICKDHTRAYINHLYRNEELSAMRMMTIHNLHFLLNLLREARTAIIEKKFVGFKDDFIDKYS